MWKWLVIVVAVLGALFAAWLAHRSVQPQPVPQPLQPPVRNPFPAAIAGAGIVEPSGENVVIGPVEMALVTKVYIKDGQAVKNGDPLFETDSRGFQAQLLATRAAVETAQAALDHVIAYRRKEEEPGLRAKVAQAGADLLAAQRAVPQAEAQVAALEFTLKDAQDTVKRLTVAVAANASPAQDLIHAQFTEQAAEANLTAAKENIKVSQARVETSKANLASSEADLNLYLAGAWPPDVKSAQAALDEAKSRVEQLTREIERRTVRAPRDGRIIRSFLHEGEFASPVDATRPEYAPIVLGDVSVLNVRADIDEFDARRFKPGARAIAFLKGQSDTQIPLEFLRVDSFVIPKRQLTNSQRELVDTRVLQAVYKITDPNASVYVGQQLDLFIEAAGEWEGAAK